jgi:hypothetical protein
MPTPDARLIDLICRFATRGSRFRLRRLFFNLTKHLRIQVSWYAPALVPPWEKCLKGSKPRLVSGVSVQSDWCGWLSDAKMQAFKVYSGEFETCYNMFSVSLNEALGLRRAGEIRKSFQMVDVIPALCARLTERLQGLLSSLDEHAKHYGVVPSVEPLDAANFRGSQGQRAANYSSLLSVVMLTQRAQFLNKISSLKSVVGDVGVDVRDAAQDISSVPEKARDRLWTALDDGHYDLTTCLGESTVLLKCFLRVLPDDQLTCFQETIALQTNASRAARPSHLIRHRRIAQFAGE